MPGQYIQLSVADENRDDVGGQISWLVGTRRVLPQRVPTGGKRASARTSAQVGVLAAAAAAGELGVPDPAQQRVVAIDRCDGLVPHIAEWQGEDSRRVDLAVMGDEEDPLAVTG